MEHIRECLLSAVRQLRKKHGPGYVRLLRHIENIGNKTIETNHIPLEKSIQKIGDRTAMLWSDPKGHTYAIELDLTDKGEGRNGDK